MWPNTNPAKAYGSMLCVMTDPTAHLTPSNRYSVLDVAPTSLSNGQAVFNYLVENDAGEYIWVSAEYLREFIAK